jgi:hypothetical protein
MIQEEILTNYVDYVNILRYDADVDIVNIGDSMLIFKKFWNESPVLMLTCILMLVVLAGSVAGLFFDSRIITGAPAWMKPAKFAISTAIFAASLAWLFQYLAASPRLKRGLARTFSFVLILEVTIIGVQAARGITSHFNASTPFDAMLFSIMGTGIAVLWICMIWVVVLLFRQSFADAAFGWALRLGMAITVIGAGSGGIMLPPNHQQLMQIEHHEKLNSIGAHTVGAPDGGQGLPAVEWSAHHGDLRIPHFFGLHALQIIPFCAWLIIRRRTAMATRAVFVLAGSYMAVLIILTWQALRGQSIAEPDAATLIAFALWLAATLCAFAWTRRGEPKRLAVSIQSIA